MRRRYFLALVLCLYAAVSAPALTIKLGSLAPTGSPWEIALCRIAAEWQKISAGSVEVKIYSGGIAGDEPDMVRKVRIGQLGAAAITVIGLHGIFSGVKALSYPMLIRNDAELSYVLTKMEPYFEQEFEKRGFKIFMWSPGGWVYFFSRQPIVGPDDLKKQKLWAWVGDPDEVQAWQNSGFQVVPLASTDIMTGLQGGMIDAVVTSPLIAASNQWFGIINNMCGEKLGPLWGGMAMSMKIWNEIPPALQPRLIDAAQKIADSLAPEIARADQEAVAIMMRYGLKTTQMPEKQVKVWAELVDRGFSMLIGKSFDRATYDLAKKYLDEYLATHPRK